jgi:hypothetical protein
MQHYSTLQQIREYRDSPALNQTFVKQLLEGKTKTFKPSLASLYGSYLDCMLTSPELLHQIYEVGAFKRPTDKVVELVEDLFAEITVEPLDWEGPEDFMYVLHSNLELHTEQVETFLATRDYYNNRPKTRVEQFIKEASAYWKFKVDIGEKTLITEEEQLKFELIATRVCLHTGIKEYFEDKPGVDIYYQYIFYFTIDGVECKGMADIIVVDHAKNLITIIDAKFTTARTLKDWIKIAFNLDYPLQLAWYREGIKQNFVGYNTECKWLTINADCEWLLPVSNFILKLGKFGGIFGQQKLTTRTDCREIPRTFPGFLEGVQLYKHYAKHGNLNPLYTATNGLLDEKTVESYYLRQLIE